MNIMARMLLGPPRIFENDFETAEICFQLAGSPRAIPISAKMLRFISKFPKAACLDFGL